MEKIFKGGITVLNPEREDEVFEAYLNYRMEQFQESEAREKTKNLK